MILPQGTVVAVTDGEKLDLYRNNGSGTELSLSLIHGVSIVDEAKGSGGRHGSTSANPDESQLAEDGFSAGIAQYLNKQVLEGEIEHLAIISAPRSLGELRKHYHKFLAAKLLLEIPKELTGHSVEDIEKAVLGA
ncbi:host attachment family protein [Rhizobium leguminosarum]|jgi:protein required for attachment to host cells|uniref:Host cell attachment protein n=1 Tax=Rhizobium leguminosarum TaxID=384 RepID=A0A4Q8XXJ4_RHILE|nr:host attachment protein [Rhizobium leguminosarum]NEK16408.1 host cell attachment protein [Rhizobium leguminosarum]NEK36817.1 host cell attachment protein [Rhizobium leguminosarum]TAU73254.1 host cell attachment protein [Rhizobium leguminosarum]TAV41890.1 host cell attachment protein [Rhizobium leguminosarum]TAV42358.1 host cell attachment protein [Rhizobium leguminosarum]